MDAAVATDDTAGMLALLLPLLLAVPIVSPAAADQAVTVERSAHSVTREMAALPVRVTGRVVTHPLRSPAGANAYLHGWPGVYFEAAFRGSRVILRFDDPNNEYRLLVDDRAPLTFAQPGRTDIVVGGLGNAPHRLRLETVTEGSDHPGTFAGFFVPPGELSLPAPPARARRIEFIGDSSMNGHGDRSTTRQCTPEEVRLRSDTQAAYPALVAKRQGADYQINAVSGRGLVRNYAGSLPDQTLPAIHPYAMPDRSGGYADASWQPQIIVIKLNADFVGDLKPGGRWATIGAVAVDYLAGFETFLATLHQRYPHAAILIWWFDAGAIPDRNTLAFVRAGQARLAATAAALGIPFVDFLPMRDLGFDRAACDSHPSLADHRKTADWLDAYLDAHASLWQGAAPAPAQ